MEHYCYYCSNVKVEVSNRQSRLDVPCKVCSEIINNNLKKAQTFFHEMCDQVSFCCGGLHIVDNVPRLNFHGKDFDSRFPTEVRARCKNGNYVNVDMGVGFYDSHVLCFYLRDFDSTCDSKDYGPKIYYEDPNFWQMVWSTLDKAAEHAWQVGLRSCEYCGYHFTDECNCRS